MSNEQIVICPHCGNKTALEILFTYQFESWWNPEQSFTCYWYLTRCKTCEEPCLFTDSVLNDSWGGLPDAHIIFPEKKSYEGVPEIITKGYHEARKVKRQSPLAFAIMIRRALEILCKEKNAEGSNLYLKIQSLADRNIIPSTFKEMADIVRLLGNSGAHDDTIEISSKQADILDDFYDAIIEYVYVAPYKLKTLQDSMSKK